MWVLPGPDLMRLACRLPKLHGAGVRCRIPSRRSRGRCGSGDESAFVPRNRGRMAVGRTAVIPWRGLLSLPIITQADYRLISQPMTVATSQEWDPWAFVFSTKTSM